MKLHKIRGVDKEVCTAEQMIAYNHSFSHYDLVKNNNYDFVLNIIIEEIKSKDRINPYGNYEPSNCRWVDYKTQNNNKRKHHKK